MVNSRQKGYRVERNIRLLMEKNNWRVVRAGGSLGEADLVCLKNGRCILLQIKSTKKKTFYYGGYMEGKLEEIPFYLVVDFGYGKIRLLQPKAKVQQNEGENFLEFIKR